jgi:drug/metabolite transporter (DMT)-like permease
MGLARVSASVTTLLWAAEPMIILALAVVMLREPVSSRLLMAMAIGFGGVLLVADLASGGGSQNSLSGVVLLLLAVLCCAFYTVLSRSLSESAESLGIVAIQQTAGPVWIAALLAMGFDNTRMGDVAAVPASQLAKASLSGLMYYAIAYWLYLTALRFVPAAIAGAYFNLIPLFGVALAIVFLGESLTVLQWPGACAVMLSVAGVAYRTADATAKVNPSAAS